MIWAGACFAVNVETGATSLRDFEFFVALHWILPLTAYDVIQSLGFDFGIKQQNY